MIEKIWSGESPLWRLLLPLSWLYGLVSGAIRLCYKLKLKRAWRAPVPVVVVGNLTAGGNGKTPVVVWLVEQLQQYVQGGYLYVPVKQEQHKRWGELSGYRAELKIRNAEIIREYRSGVPILEIASKYGLSEYAVKKIIYQK